MLLKRKIDKEQWCQQKLCYDSGDIVDVDEDDDVDDNVDVDDVEDDDDGMRITLQSVDLLVKPWQYESNGLWLCNSNIATKSANVLCWNGRQIELTIEICIKQKLRFPKL